MKTNLYNETCDMLSRIGKTWDDVRYVQIDDIYTLPEHIAAALNIDYNDGYGTAEINLSLKIVGNDWWLERAEYDGSEWWAYKTMPEPPTIFVDVKRFKELVRS